MVDEPFDTAGDRLKMFWKRITKILFLMNGFLICLCSIVNGGEPAIQTRSTYSIVASDTILAGMAETLLPRGRYFVEAILPPGQCPGHYDVKLSDIEKIQKADLVLSFRGMPFMGKIESAGQNGVVFETNGRNWMVPDSYILGMNSMAEELIRRFPADRNEILQRKEEAISHIRAESRILLNKVRQAGLPGQAVLASSMQKEPLEWMGLRVVGVYGRPETISTREVIRLVRLGRKEKVLAVIDNLQSGPDAGRSIAQTLTRPHIVLSNFPSERGYLATLQENVNTVLAALE